MGFLAIIIAITMLVLTLITATPEGGLRQKLIASAIVITDMAGLAWLIYH